MRIDLIVLGALILGAAAMGWHYFHLLEKVETLKTELSKANTTIADLDKKIALENDITEKTEGIIYDIQATPPSESGLVKPVLDNAIDSIDRLLVRSTGR